MISNITLTSKFIQVSCYLILALFFGYSSVSGQASFVSSYNEPATSDGKVSYTVGQSFTINASGAGGFAINGIQQPFSIYTLGVTDEFVAIEVSVFPNPVSKILVLKTGSVELKKSSYTLYDLNGTLISNKLISDRETQIDMSELNAATYFLNVLDSKKTLKSFKIIKY